MTKSVITFLFVLSAPFICAQDFYTIFNADIEYSPNNTYSYEPTNTVDVQENAMNLNLPLQRKNGDAFLLGLGAHKLRLTPDFVEEPASVPSDTVFSSTYQYYRYRLQAGYNKKWNEDFSTVVMLMGRISSDMVEGIQPNIFQYGGFVLFSKKRNEEVTVKYGLYMNTEFFGLFIVPLLGLDWKYSDRLRIFGVLPANLYLQYRVNHRIRTGIFFQAPTYSYRVSEQSLENPDQERISTYVHNQKNALYAYLDVYLTKSLVFQARIGRSVFRRIRLYDSEDKFSVSVSGIGFGKNRQPIPVPVYRDFADGWLLNASIAYRFNLE